MDGIPSRGCYASAATRVLLAVSQSRRVSVEAAETILDGRPVEKSGDTATADRYNYKSDRSLN
jgi:hypothetical protein